MVHVLFVRLLWRKVKKESNAREVGVWNNLQ